MGKIYMEMPIMGIVFLTYWGPALANRPGFFFTPKSISRLQKKLHFMYLLGIELVVFVTEVRNKWIKSQQKNYSYEYLKSYSFKQKFKNYFFQL